MKLKTFEPELSVCKLNKIVDISSLGKPCFWGITDEEISLVCPTASVPGDAFAREDGWKAFRIEGVLDFSMIGVLARISSVLAAEGIGIFVMSTYNTDYILVKKENFDRAVDALSQAGYEIA